MTLSRKRRKWRKMRFSLITNGTVILKKVDYTRVQLSGLYSIVQDYYIFSQRMLAFILLYGQKCEMHFSSVYCVRAVSVFNLSAAAQVRSVLVLWGGFWPYCREVFLGGIWDKTLLSGGTWCKEVAPWNYPSSSVLSARRTDFIPPCCTGPASITLKLFVCSIFTCIFGQFTIRRLGWGHSSVEELT